MTWSYSGDPGDSTKDAVRFHMQDTDSTDELMTDEEIAYLIDQWYDKYPSPIFVAAMACETLSAKFAREVSVSADGVSVGAQELQTKYSELAASLRDQYKMGVDGGAPESFGNNWGEEFDQSIKPLSFSVNQFDNPQVGGQNYGGTSRSAADDPERYI